MMWSKNLSFTVSWVIANVIGFVTGNFLGATDGGLLEGILGDLAFGATFGLAQWTVLSWRFPAYRWQMLIWVLASSLGFTLGVRLATRLSFPLVGDHHHLGAVFGVFVGSCIGLVEWVALRWMLPREYQAKSYIWIPASILAWILGESIAFFFTFTAEGVPFIGLVIGTVTGACLFWLFEQSSQKIHLTEVHS